MNDNTVSVPKVAGIHWSFWIIGIVAILWNLMGCLNFYMQMNADALAKMPESHRAIAESRPLWATAGFALSVFAGVLGGVLMLLKKSLAHYAFVASLIGSIVTMFHALIMGGIATRFGPFELVLGIAMPLILGLFFVWYTKKAQRRGLIG